MIGFGKGHRMHFSDYDNERLLRQLSGERFRVVYELYGTESACRSAANEICVEQSIEFPVSETPDGAIKEQILGRIERFEKLAENRYETEVSYAVETTAGEYTQLLNVIFGNFSIKPDVKVSDIRLRPAVRKSIRGPRFGIGGLRELLQTPSAPILFTALKPVGMTASNLARVAGLLAEGGIQIIKDDHGITNQTFAPFRERVKACADAVQEASAKTGRPTLYIANITAPFDELLDRAHYAKECGVGGVMIAPGLTGFDAMKRVAEDDSIALPVFSHPAFSGCYAVNPQGFSCRCFYGKLMRMSGADAVIYPNYGERFTLSREDCISIAEQGKAEWEHFKPMFSAPAGGMQIDRVPDMLRSYGSDIMLLIGGGLFSSGDDLKENCRRFAQAVSESSSS